MEHQLQIFPANTPAYEKGNINDQSCVKILNWNIANPSLKRADKQIEFIVNTRSNVLILTEAKNSAGCSHIYSSLFSLGFEVYFQAPDLNSNKYAVIVAVKGFNSSSINIDFSFLKERISLIQVTSNSNHIINILGLYVPSRGPNERKNVDKKEFQKKIMDFLSNIHNKNFDNFLVVGGDLNVLEPNHEPKYPVFGDWEYDFYDSFGRIGLADTYRFLHLNKKEYSWFGRFNDGYRFDHFFISDSKTNFIQECNYIHEPRYDKLSDHSAMILTLRA